MPKKLVSEQQILELQHILIQSMQMEDWYKWIEFQLWCDTPSLDVWRGLIFGGDAPMTPNSRGPLTAYFDLARPACAGIYLHTLSGKFGRIETGKNGFAPFVVMHGHWRYHLYPAYSDVPHHRWCDVTFGTNKVLKNTENKNIPAATLFDILIRVWNSDDYPDSTRSVAQLLACTYLLELITTIEENAPRQTFAID